MSPTGDLLVTSIFLRGGPASSLLRRSHMLHWHGTSPGAAYPSGKHNLYHALGYMQMACGCVAGLSVLALLLSSASNGRARAFLKANKTSFVSLGYFEVEAAVVDGQWVVGCVGRSCAAVAVVAVGGGGGRCRWVSGCGVATAGQTRETRKARAQARRTLTGQAEGHSGKHDGPKPT